jgi:hypothetical protein
MSTETVMPEQQQHVGERSPTTKSLSTHQLSSMQQQPTDKTGAHPLHQYDWTVMSSFLESCVGKLKEQQPKWRPADWASVQPMPTNLPWEQKNEWCNPLVLSQKQRVYEAFAKLARETGEPMILMPSFDYGDIQNFERFLQALKHDGINAIGKYKHYLVNKDMRKYEVDLVVVHARYGVMLIEVKDCDHLDSKRRSRAKAQLTSARSCFEMMARLIIEAKGWTQTEAHVPITEFIALPNVHVRPVAPTTTTPTPTPLAVPTTTTTPSTVVPTTVRVSSRQLNYIVKPDLDNGPEFAKWWTKFVVEPKQQLLKQAETEGKTNKFDVTVLNCMTGLIQCIRNNSIMPVVYPESGNMLDSTTLPTTTPSPVPTEEDPSKKTTELEQTFQQALNLRAEFFQAEHELVRSQSKVVVVAKDVERIRKIICLQTLWLLLNDSSKKISVVCSEMNKPYYEEFFARQRKLYNNLNNVRFYTDVHSCAVQTQHTIRKDGEIWFFDSQINGKLSDVMERVKDLNAFWLFTTQDDMIYGQYKSELERVSAKIVKIEERKVEDERQAISMPWLNGASLKMPLRLQCDLLVIGDIVGTSQMKSMYNYLKSNQVANQSMYYQGGNSSSHYHHQQQGHQYPQMQKLNFNPSKKFKSVKFIRGGTIDNLRNSLKMHDSVQAQVILLHVGDEDLFKTRNSQTTTERIKELANLVKEYCPKSFVIISTLMRRMSRTENGVSNEVNKGIVNFCKQTRDQQNFYYMINNHFEPEYHTQEGRMLNNKGLRLYVENVLFVIDHFMIRNNKQH